MRIVVNPREGQATEFEVPTPPGLEGSPPGGDDLPACSDMPPLVMPPPALPLPPALPPPRPGLVLPAAVLDLAGVDMPVVLSDDLPPSPPPSPAGLPPASRRLLSDLRALSVARSAGLEGCARGILLDFYANSGAVPRREVMFVGTSEGSEVITGLSMIAGLGELRDRTPVAGWFLRTYMENLPKFHKLALEFVRAPADVADRTMSIVRCSEGCFHVRSTLRGAYSPAALEMAGRMDRETAGLFASDDERAVDLLREAGPG